MNREAFIGNQIPKLAKEDVLFGADLGDLTLDPDVA
jgi:hypothetical protein